jgi:hypothetical protein
MGIEFDQIIVSHDVENWYSGCLEQAGHDLRLVPLRVLWCVEPVRAPQEIAGQKNSLDFVFTSGRHEPLIHSRAAMHVRAGKNVHDEVVELRQPTLKELVIEPFACIRPRLDPVSTDQFPVRIVRLKARRILPPSLDSGRAISRSKPDTNWTTAIKAVQPLRLQTNREIHRECARQLRASIVKKSVEPSRHRQPRISMSDGLAVQGNRRPMAVPPQAP